MIETTVTMKVRQNRGQSLPDALRNALETYIKENQARPGIVRIEGSLFQVTKRIRTL